ncbi:MAG TPA: hypothetical protein VMJ35_02900 [Dongiaceae bacterium]|nr:hypothetical protein [Dongiaceae bacterium]
MIEPLDVYRVNEDKLNVWISGTVTLVDALETIRRKGPGEYLIVSQRTGHEYLYEVAVDGHVVFRKRT